MGTFETWWRRILLVAGGIGRVIGFYIGARILLAAPHDTVQKPWLYIVALTLMGVAGAGLLEKALGLFGDFLTFLRTPPVAPPPERRSEDSSEQSPRS